MLGHQSPAVLVDLTLRFDHALRIPVAERERPWIDAVRSTIDLTAGQSSDKGLLACAARTEHRRVTERVDSGRDALRRTRSRARYRAGVISHRWFADTARRSRSSATWLSVMGHSVPFVVPDLLGRMAPNGAASPPGLTRRRRQNRSAALEHPVGSGLRTARTLAPPPCLVTWRGGKAT
jgi:hypothetical protein